MSKKPLYIAIAAAAVAIMISVIVSEVFAASPNFLQDVISRRIVHERTEIGPSGLARRQLRDYQRPKKGGGWLMHATLLIAVDDLFFRKDADQQVSEVDIGLVEKTPDGTAGYHPRPGYD
jgi:hypothetical protein